MASQAICLLVILYAASVTNSLTLDEDASSDVINTAGLSGDGQIAILVRGPSRVSSSREELLHAKGAEDNSISLFYNSKTNKVSLESLNGGHIKSVSWGLGAHPRGTILLVVNHSRVKIVVSCKPLHWHSMSNRHDIFKLLTNQKLKLYHEENAPVEVYSNEKSALDSISCYHQDELKPPTLVTVDSDVDEVKDFIKKEERMKMEEEMQGDYPNNNYIDPNIYPTLPQPTVPPRGDIPAIPDVDSCDEEILRQLKLLRQTVELLRRELADQKGNIDNLRNQLHICCNRVPSPPVERCSGSSCYPGY